MNPQDEGALGNLIDRYTASLDEGGFDEAWAQAMFTEAVVLQYPVGSHSGRAGVSAFIGEIMQRWAATHHHTGNYLIDVAGDRADLRWSVIASHVPAATDGTALRGDPFQLGGWFSAQAERTAAGWRFARMNLQIVWTRGTPVIDVADPGVLAHR
jgi:hypothetical protein